MNKTYHYGNLFSTVSGHTPTLQQMISGELAFNLNADDIHMWISDGSQVIDLGSKLGGGGDEETIHSEMVGGAKQFSTLLRLKKVTSADTAEWAAIPANVRERYKLVDADGNNIVLASGVTSAITEDTPSEYIDVYKDSSIVELWIGTQWDEINATTGVITKKQVGDEVTVGGVTHIVEESDFQYLNEAYYAGGWSGTTSGDGQFHIVMIDMRKFIVEAEYASGITWDSTANKVRAVVDYASGDVITAYTSGDYSAAGVANGSESGFTVTADGLKLQHVQEAISALHANVLPISGYSVSGGSEDVFLIENGDTVAKALMKIENAIVTNGNGIGDDGTSVEVNNTGILFKAGSAPIVLLSAGTF